MAKERNSVTFKFSKSADMGSIAPSPSALSLDATKRKLIIYSPDSQTVHVFEGEFRYRTSNSKRRLDERKSSISKYSVSDYTGNDNIFTATSSKPIKASDYNEGIRSLENLKSILLSGNDSFYGSNSDDTLHGGPGDDIFYDSPGADTYYGDNGNDRFIGSSFGDTYFTGEGKDYVFLGDGQQNTINLGKGKKTVELSKRSRDNVIHGDKKSLLTIKSSDGSKVITQKDYLDPITGEKYDAALIEGVIVAKVNPVANAASLFTDDAGFYVNTSLGVPYRPSSGDMIWKSDSYTQIDCTPGVRDVIEVSQSQNRLATLEIKGFDPKEDLVAVPKYLNGASFINDLDYTVVNLGAPDAARITPMYGEPFNGYSALI